MTKVNGESVGDTLGDFVSDFGIPDHLTFDGAKVQVGNNTKFRKNIQKHDIKWHIFTISNQLIFCMTDDKPAFLE